MSNPWFRLYAEFSTDPKVQILSEQDQRRLIMVLCMRCNGDVTLQDKHVTFQLRITPEDWAASKAIFIEAGFIDIDNNVLNWDKRQYVSDSSAARVAKHRTLHKTNPVTQCNVTVTPPDTEQNRTDTEKSREEERQRREETEKIIKFCPPIPNDLLQEWELIRKKKKSGEVTERVFKGVEREAKKAGVSAERAVEICCEKGWASFDASWMPSGGIAKQDSLKRTGDLLTGRIRQDDTFTIDVD